MSNEKWQLVKTEIRKFGPIQWAFVLLVTLPLEIIAAPFVLIGAFGLGVANAIESGHGWLIKKILNYSAK